MMLPTESGKGSNGEGGEIHSVIIQKLDALNAELTEAEAKRIEKEAIYRLVRTGNEDVILGLAGDSLAQQAGSMVLTEGGGVSNLQQLRQQQSALKVNLAEASATYGENNRHLKDLQTQIHALDEQIHEELQAITRRAQADFQLAKQTEGELQRQFDQQQVAASKLNETAVQFAVLSQGRSLAKDCMTISTPGCKKPMYPLASKQQTLPLSIPPARNPFLSAPNPPIISYSDCLSGCSLDSPLVTL